MTNGAVASRLDEQGASIAAMSVTAERFADVIPAARNERIAVGAWALLVLLALPGVLGPWDPRIGAATVVPIAAGLIGWRLLPGVADRASWRALCFVAPVAAAAWAVALAGADGFAALAEPVHRAGEYLTTAAALDSPSRFLGSFSDSLAGYGTHVRGHPPGMPLLLWAMSRAGLGGAGWAAAMMIGGGAAAVAAAMIAVREVAGEPAARAATPFLVFAPAAVWIATSADALFAGVGAWAVALGVIATGREGARSRGAAAAGGVLMGIAMMLTYGAVLLAAVPAAIAWRRRRLDCAASFVTGALMVLAVFAAAGFWWPAGLLATRRAYLSGVAQDRGYWFSLAANLGALGLAIGPAAAAAMVRMRRHAAGALVAGGVAAVALADLSGMSKGETERIWLLFVPWLVIACAALPNRRAWLAAQIAVALGVQTMIATPW